MVICLERGADLHIAKLMLLPLTVSCCSKIQIGFTFLVPAYLGSPGQRAVKRVSVCVCVLYKRFTDLKNMFNDINLLKSKSKLQKQDGLFLCKQHNWLAKCK